MMDQDLRSTDGVTFYSVTATDLGASVGTFNEIHFTADTTDLRGPDDSFQMLFYGNLVVANFNADTGEITAFSATSATVGTLDTGHGANELYVMDQDVDTGSAVTFAELTVQIINNTESIIVPSLYPTNLYMDEDGDFALRPPPPAVFDQNPPG